MGAAASFRPSRSRTSGCGCGRWQTLPEDPDPAVVHNLLLELVGRLYSLAANASAFMGSLQRTIDLQEIDEEAFLAYKDRLISYLERFVSELVVKAFDIVRALLRKSSTSSGPGRVDGLLLAWRPSARRPTQHREQSRRPGWQRRRPRRGNRGRPGRRAH